MDEAALFKKMDITDVRDESEVEVDWKKAVQSFAGKVIVLDDDPTGVQTVYDVPVYTSWTKEECRNILSEESKVVFILTNSRALSYDETKLLHTEIADNLKRAAHEKNIDSSSLLIVLRGDSTMRAHYPVEMDTIVRELYGDAGIDAEIHVPAFIEGGRYTLHGTHYLWQDALVPVAQTEFAHDPVFAFENSDITKWVCEKRKADYDPKRFLNIDIETLRKGDTDSIAQSMMDAPKGTGIVVDAAAYRDLETFCIALMKCIGRGKRYVFRSGASMVRVLGGMEQRPCLTKQELNPRGEAGIVIVGSFVKKTTEQLAALKTLDGIDCYEIRVEDILKNDLKEQLKQIMDGIGASMKAGRTSCIYTSRTYFGGELSQEEKISNAKTISNFLIEIVRNLPKQPGYLIAKGGITSSDIGVKGLGVRRAMVLGQAEAGVPVWRIDTENQFKGMNYVIFPGNVGQEDTLKKLIQRLDS